MTEHPAGSAEREQDPGITELWTYGGITAGNKSAEKFDVWWTADRDQLYYGLTKGRSYVVGHVYTVQVHREAGEDGKMTTRRLTWPEYKGRQPDTDWGAQVAAEAYASERELARQALERRAKRDPGPLDEAIAPLEKLAASMSYAQREALIAMVTRRVYRAQIGGRK